MQDKKYQYISYLVSGLMITFLITFILGSSITNTNAREESLTIPSSIQHELDERKVQTGESIPSMASQRDIYNIREVPEPPIQLNFRIAGTVLVGKGYTYALILEEATGRQNLYSVGETVKGAKVLKIDRDSIVIEKDGRTHVLRITRGSYTDTPLTEILFGDGPPTIGVSAELPFFEPAFSETGPPVDENAPVEVFPLFEPITNNTGPSINTEGLYEDLLEFTPFISDTGLPE